MANISKMNVSDNLIKPIRKINNASGKINKRVNC
jgi:hypothetical protein